VSERGKRKPIPISDLEEVALFRAELQIAAKLQANGMSIDDVRTVVWSDEQEAAMKRARAKGGAR
jgi:hypothetical protein